MSSVIFEGNKDLIGDIVKVKISKTNPKYSFFGSVLDVSHQRVA